MEIQNSLQIKVLKGKFKVKVKLGSFTEVKVQNLRKYFPPVQG